MTKPRYYVSTNPNLKRGGLRFVVRDRATGDWKDAPTRVRREAQELADAMNSLDAAERMDPHDRQDFITDSIRSGKYRWCRARLFTALAQAERQGVLDEVIGEVIDYDMFLAAECAGWGQQVDVLVKKFGETVRKWMVDEEKKGGG